MGAAICRTYVPINPIYDIMNVPWTIPRVGGRVFGEVFPTIYDFALVLLLAG